MRFRRVVTLVGTLTAATSTFGAAPDTGWASAIGLVLLIGVVLICLVTGRIGYAVCHATRFKLLSATVGALVPIVVIVFIFWDHARKSEQWRAAHVEARKAVIRVAQARIDSMCQELQARETRGVDLERSLHIRVISDWPALDVPLSGMDWPLPLDRVALAFSPDYQEHLRRLRFEQSYFERRRGSHISKQLDYVEHSDTDGQLYALATTAHWSTLISRLDDESRQELSVHIGRGATNPAKHFIGYRPRKPLARYGMELLDVSTREDRNHWTARIRVKVFDVASGDEVLSIERALPVLVDALGDRTGDVRLCAKQGHDAVASNPGFDWLGYLAREVSAEPNE